MRLQGSPPSWRATISEPTGLSVLLYVRDAAEIAPHVRPSLPPLTPSVPRTAGEVDTALLAAQWSQRWSDATGPEGLTDIGMERPDSPTFDTTPELRRVYEDTYPAACEWCAAYKAARRRQRRAPKEPAHSLGSLVREWEVDAGRRASPFKLDIYVVPIDGTTPHPITDNKFIVPAGLVAHSERYAAWLREVVARLSR